MTKFRAALFDMDGVLVDSEPLHARAWEKVFDRHAFSYEARWFVPWIGIPDRKLAAHLAAEHTVDAAELLREKWEAYRRIIESEMVPMPGVPERLDALAAAGLALGLASSSGQADVRRTLDLVGLSDHFGAVVAAEDVTRHKPEPDAYLRAAELLGVPPEACVVIEDSPAGSLAARRAGCRVLAVTTTHAADRLPEADHLFAATAEAIDWILSNLAIS